MYYKFKQLYVQIQLIYNRGVGVGEEEWGGSSPKPWGE